jgi:hypothetical protein
MPQYPLLPTPFDNLKSPTSEKQLETEADIIKHLEPFAISSNAPDQERRSIDSYVVYVFFATEKNWDHHK